MMSNNDGTHNRELFSTDRRDNVILRSREYAKELKIDPSMPQIPACTGCQQKGEFAPVSEMHAYEYDKPFFAQQHELLAQLGAAVFYLDGNACVMLSGGDPVLLRELRQKNIRFSVSLQEQFVGTTAVAVAARTRKSAWVIGTEHYLEMFSGYATYAQLFSPLVPGKWTEEKPRDYFNVYFIPVQRLDTLSKNLIEYFSESYLSMFSSFYLKKDSLKSKAISDHLTTQKSCMILIDDADVIVEVNQRMCKTFSSDTKKIYGKTLYTLFPELEPVINAARQGNRTEKVPVLLSDPFHTEKKEKREFYADVTVCKENDLYIGTMITLTESKYIQRLVNKIITPATRFTFDSLIGEDQHFVFTKQLAMRAAEGSSNILICGESGTGKELFAQAIHNGSDRRLEPFIAINCAALPKELIGSELFGYVEGAFTGAKRGGAMGKFEQANKGTIFLDEIGEMSLDMQSMLLRVIEERVVTRIGGTNAKPVDVRIIAATNRNLENEILENRFRLDLYYRLNVIRLDTVPLRQRKGDIPLLAHYYLQDMNQRFSKNISDIAPDTMEILSQYGWPGNVRELRNILERCVNLTNGTQITTELLPAYLTGSAQSGISGRQERNSVLPGDAADLRRDSFAEFQMKQVVDAMKRHNGNKTVVAKELGISRPRLYRMLEKIKEWE